MFTYLYVHSNLTGGGLPPRCTSCNQPRRDFLKGGIEEHSRAFTEQVSKRPDEFYDFILSLGRRDDIHISYLAAGIDGLVKADYNVVKIKELV